MATFAILIDDGELVATNPAAVYPNILMAMADTLRSAAIIAAERVKEVGLQQSLVCEVQDCETRELREMVVSFAERAPVPQPFIVA